MRTKQLFALCALLFTTLSLSAQWVKQNIPTTEGTMYYLFGTDKNTMWTYTRDVIPDPANVKKAEFLRTGDGGKTYKKGTLFANAAEAFYHIQPRDGKNAHMVSADINNNFTFQRTVDSGATWQMMPYQPETFPDHVYFWDDNNGILISDPDKIGLVIMYTTDGGNTYTRLPTTNYPSIRDSEYPIVGDFHVVGDVFFFWSVDNATGEWRVWRSLDRGRNWTVGEWFTTGTTSGFTPRIAFTDANNGLLMQGIGNITENPLYTEDGGATWHQSGKMPSYAAWPIKNIPNTQTMMAFFQDSVSNMLYSALTNDLGKTWNTRKDILPYKLDSSFVPLGFPAFAFTNLDIVNNNAAWARFSLRELHRYDSSTPLVPEKPDLDLELKADNDGLPLYGSVKYTLTVKNRGISPATGVKINWLPPYKRTNNGAGAYAYQGAYADKGYYDSWNGVWSLDKIEAGASATATFHLFIVKNNENITQTAQVMACNETDLDSAPNNMSGAAKEDDEVGFVAKASTDLLALPNDGFKAKTPEFMISPNPAKDKINVFINADADNFWSIRVLNNVGQVVYTKNGQSNGLVDIDAKSLVNGLYLVEYEALGDRKVEKIMVQH
jgi:Domain of unknown function DUF11/Secretion system C-terminal sorting domain